MEGDRLWTENEDECWMGGIDPIYCQLGEGPPSPNPHPGKKPVSSISTVVKTNVPDLPGHLAIIMVFLNVRN